MSTENIQEELTKETGIRFCEICGLPFYPRNCLQRLCGNKDCLKKYKAKYVKNWQITHPERYKQLKRESAKRCRRRKREAANMDTTLKEVQMDYQDKERSEEEASKYENYAEYQKHKILAQVPKINTEL